MRLNKFDPESKHFDEGWTAKSAPAVSTEKAERLVGEVFHGYPIGPHSRSRFVRIFGKLTACGEEFNLLNLRLLQNLSPGMRKAKHCVCQHWLELARVAATSMVDMVEEATPIFLLKRARTYVGACSVVGDDYPNSFGRDVRLEFWANDIRHHTDWANVAHILLTLDWNAQEGKASLQNFLKKLDKESNEFKTLTNKEVTKMVHMQLRLSSCGVAEVKGSINETCVKILAELLAYKLKILKFHSSLQLKGELRNFQPDADHRGTLVLVKDIPPASNIQSFAVPQRMILCHAAESTERSRSRSPRKWFGEVLGGLKLPSWTPKIELQKSLDCSFISNSIPNFIHLWILEPGPDPSWTFREGQSAGDRLSKLVRKPNFRLLVHIFGGPF